MSSFFRQNTERGSIVFMKTGIFYAPSAFKHGFNEADIRQAIRTRISEVLIDEYEDKYAIIGFDTKGKTLEIIYNLIDNQTMRVYHAMNCRKSFQKKYDPKGEYHG